MSSETGKRNPDHLNTVGVVVAALAGSVLVYVSIVLLQAYYMNDTAEAELAATYQGQDLVHQTLKSEQLGHIQPSQGIKNANQETFVIPIDRAIELVVAEAQRDPAFLVPSQGRSDQPSAAPSYGRPKPLSATIPAPVAAPAGAGTSPAPAGSPAASGGGQAPAPGAGSAATGGSGAHGP